MHRRLLLSVMTIVACMVGAVGASTPASTAGGLTIALDCDVSTTAIEASCPAGYVYGTHDVGIVLTNASGGGVTLDGFELVVRAEEDQLDPLPGNDGNFNGNPDANQSIFPQPTTWACDAPGPQPDVNSNPAIADSYIKCTNGDFLGPVVPDGATMLLATVHYKVMLASGWPSPVSFVPGFGSVEFLGAPNIDCGAVPADCAGTTITAQAPLPDPDGDGIPYPGPDNCPDDANPGLENNDRDLLPLGIYGKLFDDVTVPHSDRDGDACDADDDNDGLTDTEEAALVAAQPPCPTASGPTDAFERDTDGDRVLDGAECALGRDPLTADADPQPPAADFDNDGVPTSIENSIGSNPTSIDTDLDGVLDGVEFRYYNTGLLSPNTDGDVCSDAKEIASINAGWGVDSLDLSQVAQHFSASTAAPYIVPFDVNKDGKINSLDLQFVAKSFGMCFPALVGPDLRVAVTDNADPLSYFNTNRVTITITNAGNQYTSEPVMVTVRQQGQASMTVQDNPYCPYTSAAGMHCALGQIAPGSQVSFYVDFTIEPVVPHNSVARTCAEVTAANEAEDRVHDNSDCEITILNGGF